MDQDSARSCDVDWSQGGGGDRNGRPAASTASISHQSDSICILCACLSNHVFLCASASIAFGCFLCSTLSRRHDDMLFARLCASAVIVMFMLFVSRV